MSIYIYIYVIVRRPSFDIVRRPSSVLVRRPLCEFKCGSYNLWMLSNDVKLQWLHKSPLNVFQGVWKRWYAVDSLQD